MRRTVLILATAALYGLSYPPYGAPWVAWVALVPLLLALRELSVRGALLLGWLSGLAMAYAITDFLPEAVAARNRFAYLPFGLGPRACIGEHLALIEMHAHAIILARRFALTLVPGQTIEIEPQVNLRTRSPVRMHVELR